MKERIVEVNRISNSPRVIFVDQHGEPMLAVEAGNTEQKIRISGTINTKTTENQKPSNQTIDNSRDITNDSQASNGIKKEQMQPENPIKKHSSKFSMRPEETVKILEEINKKREAGEFKAPIKQESKTDKVGDDNKSEAGNVAEMEIINFWKRQSKFDEMSGKNNKPRKALEPWELEMIRLGQLKIGYSIEELKSATKQAKDEIPNGTFKTEPKKQDAKGAESVTPAEKQPGKNQPKTEEKNEEMRQALGSMLIEQMKGLLEKRKTEENLKKYEEKWFNEGLAKEAAEKLAREKALAEAKKQLEEQKDLAAKEKAEAEKERKFHEEITRKRNPWQMLKIMFHRYPKDQTTSEDKAGRYLKRHYWTTVGAALGGAAVTLGTWAGMQATGNYLPFIGDPIKEVINNLFINGTLVK